MSIPFNNFLNPGLRSGFEGVGVGPRSFKSSLKSSSQQSTTQVFLFMHLQSLVESEGLVGN